MSGGSDLGFGANTWFDGAEPFMGSFVGEGNLNGPSGLPVAGQHARTAPIGFDLAFYTFDSDEDGELGEVEDSLLAGEHWISFIATADSNADFAGLSLKKFFGDEVLYIGKVGGAGGTTWGIDAQDGNGGISAGGDISVETFLAARLTIGSGASDDTIDLFINPALDSGTPTTPDLSLAFNEQPGSMRAIDELRIGSQNGQFLVDEIRIGTTFDDVIGNDTLPGDYDGNDIVDTFDYTTWTSQFGMAGDLSADGNSDGFVNAADYTIWRDNLPQVANIAATESIPEPAAWSLALLAFCFAVQCRQAQRGAACTIRLMWQGDYACS